MVAQSLIYCGQYILETKCLAWNAGLAELEAGQPLEFTLGSVLSLAADGAVFVSENLFIFIFAAIGLDYCFKMRLLSPFPIKRLGSQSNLRWGFIYNLETIHAFWKVGILIVTPLFEITICENMSNWCSGKW